MMGIAATTTFTACSDDNTPEKSTPSYNWSEDGGLKACDNLLFENGTQIGNGDNEFVFKGKQTLKRALICSRVGCTWQLAQNLPLSLVPLSRATSKPWLLSL